MLPAISAGKRLQQPPSRGEKQWRRPVPKSTVLPGASSTSGQAGKATASTEALHLPAVTVSRPATESPNLVAVSQSASLASSNALWVPAKTILNPMGPAHDNEDGMGTIVAITHTTEEDLATTSALPSNHGREEAVSFQAESRETYAARGGASKSMEQQQAPPSSKLMAEVERLSTKGQHLIRREGCEAEGVALLGKALWARTRFPALQRGAAEGGDRPSWDHGEAFVVLCCKLASRLVLSLQPNAQRSVNDIMQSVEAALTDPENDCFAGFQPLRHHLIGLTLNTIANLQRLNHEGPEAVADTLERAARIEAGRMSTLTMFNLAAAYVECRRYEDACNAVAACIESADYYLSLPVVNNQNESWVAFSQAVASHAALSHLLLSTLGTWSKMDRTALHHARLALACCQAHLGTTNALTTRCVDRLNRVQDHLRKKMDDAALQESGVAGARTMGVDGRKLSLLEEEPPFIPLHAGLGGLHAGGDGSGTSNSSIYRQLPPSQVLPFALAVPAPPVAVDWAQNITRRSGLPPSRSLLPQLTVPQQSPAAQVQVSQQQRATPQTPNKGKQRTKASEMKTWTPEGAKNKSKSGLPLVPKEAFAATISAMPPKVPRPPPSSQLHSATAPASNSFTRRHNSFPQIDAVDASEFPQLNSPKTQDRLSDERVVSVLPKAQLAAYQRIMSEVQQTVASFHPAALPSAPTIVEPVGGRFAGAEVEFDPTSRTRRGTQLLAPRQRRPTTHTMLRLSGDDPLRGATTSGVASSALLRSDAHLRRLSVLCPDHTDADEVLWHRCATKIQKQFRGYRVRRYHVEPKRQEALYWVRVFPSVETILSAWRDHVACQPAVREKKRRRAQRQLDRTAAVIQAFARMQLSAMLMCDKVREMIRVAMIAKRRTHLKETAAVFLQAWTRGVIYRQRYLRQLQAVVRIQRTWRCFKLFVALRLWIFRRRIRTRQWIARLYDTASVIQRWWRRYIPQRRAVLERVSRQRALATYMSDFLHRDRAYWESVSHLDDDLCRDTVRRWARGYHMRRKLFMHRERTRRQSRAAAAIQRWFRFCNSRQSLGRRIAQHRHQLALKRRAEEVHEGVVDIQRVVRGMLGRRRAEVLRHQLASRHAAARFIQNVARRYIRRRSFVALRKQRFALSERYLTAQHRRYSAIAIQSTWRMYKSRQMVDKYRQFLLVDRHTYAQRIQRLVRRFLALLITNRRRQSCHEIGKARQWYERRAVAAIKIQSVVRMSLKRNELRLRQNTAHRGGRRLVFPTLTRRTSAALTLQTTWRRYAAWMYMQQLRQGRIYVNASRITNEHLHVYATVIQCFTRRFILAPNRCVAARAAAQARAALRIQRHVKAFLDRRRALVALLEQEERDVLSFLREEHFFAAMRIQKHVRGYLTKSWYANVRKSIDIVQRLVRGFLARCEARRRRQRRSGNTDRVLADEAREAALVIQRAWRGSQRLDQ